MGAEHDFFGFQHCHTGQRHVNGHLITVKVCVEGGTDQRVNLDGVSFNEHRHECLDSQSVQRGGPVDHDRPVFDNIF